MNTAEHIKTKFIKWLLQGNLSFNKQSCGLGCEILFSKNRRKADILIFTNEIHAIEIKGDRDNLSKLPRQLDDYLKTFEKTTIVTTAKYLGKIKSMAPHSVGIILFDGNSFKIIKTSKRNIAIHKLNLLMFLTKSELCKEFKIKFANTLSTDQVRRIIAKKFTRNIIKRSVYSSLKIRHKLLFRSFLKDAGENFLWDEIRGLSGKVGSLSC